MPVRGTVSETFDTVRDSRKARAGNERTTLLTSDNDTRDCVIRDPSQPGWYSSAAREIINGCVFIKPVPRGFLD